MKSAAPAKRPHKRSVRRRLRPVRLLLRLCAWGVALGALWCAYIIWLIASYDPPKTVPHADVAIILGAALWSDKPSPGLRERLDYGYDLYKQGYFKAFIVTGGHDHNGSTLSEAEGMRDYLVAKGVPQAAIVLENDARSTYENLLFSKPLALKRGWDKLLIVTHDFHAPRAADIASYLDYPQETASIGTKTKVLKPWFNYSREVLAFTKWKLDEGLMKLGVQLPDSF